MSKLIVLSNRVTLPQPQKQQAGGLAVALEDALNGIGGIWVGWHGEKSDLPQDQFDQLIDGAVEYHTCALSHDQYVGFYCGFANDVLWPFMHQQQQYIQFNESDYQTYQNVNRKFAQHLHRISDDDDIIWVHDYHFLSVAHYCRKLGMKNRIGFFLHIPFPSEHLWQQVPHAKTLARDLADYDLLGLQTEYDQEHCFQFLRKTLNLKSVQQNVLIHETRQVSVQCYPIGVHPSAIQKRAAAEFSVPLDFNLNPNKPIKNIISVDRIDYSKGLLEKISALHQFYAKQPEMLEQVCQLQIACPCRLDVDTYQDLYQRFKKDVESLNQAYPTQHGPVFDCRYDSLDHVNLMRLYRHSDICWVNSVKDGMNLVAKEYIAAQDPENPGVLILSKYAGASEHMAEAIIVDPYNTESMIQGLNRAITMSKDERISRYQLLYQGLKDFDIIDWRNQFLEDLRNTGQTFYYIKRPNQVSQYQPYF
ncbi:trehalose-6-phosphate synthase [Acinetobacter sp. NCu2D-2]|uniref:alpha,alpha-trehalose-phosphate synthase (UDP-forming) n=1 Tax=Acinetobacter sp. NCu2D-2 TaxID=1608473 RepID=UPI0007CDDDC1|nr:trehalose-6-phosphate synthase [Acinetobacter sp. NCu2D-2]ANF81767.1 trehalose-6-phosphate synthase [Acinetobacter sp. NCu2D-2]